MPKQINKVWVCISKLTPKGKTTESAMMDISVVNEYSSAKITLETLNNQPYLLITIVKP